MTMPISDIFKLGSGSGQLRIGESGRGAGQFSGNKLSSSPILPATGAPQSVGRPSGMPDYDFLFFAESAAADGLQAVNTIDGHPNTYTKMTHGFVLDKSRGDPWINCGLFTSLTVASGCAGAGSMSYGGDMSFHGSPFLTDPAWAARQSNGGMPVRYQQGENFLAYNDNGATNEQGVGCFLVTYGKPGHRWPQDLDELLRVSGLKYREIWEPRFPVATASVTVMTGGTALSTTTDTKWIDANSQYYILGATMHSILTGGGFLNVSNGLPEYLKVRNNIIPFGDNDHAAQHEGAKFCPAYWPIGPFTAANWPIIAALATVANAQVASLYIAKA